MTHAPFLNFGAIKLTQFICYWWIYLWWEIDGCRCESPGTCVKRTVACLPLAPTEEDHDPSVPAHTEPGRRGLRIQHVHVSGPGSRADRTMLKGKLCESVQRVDGNLSVREHSRELLYIRKEDLNHLIYIITSLTLQLRNLCVISALVPDYYMFTKTYWRTKSRLKLLWSVLEIWVDLLARKMYPVIVVSQRRLLLRVLLIDLWLYLNNYQDHFRYNTVFK